MNTEVKQKEFCRLTGLTRKSLLIYEEKGLLVPCRIDSSTGYRFYSSLEIDRGTKISILRALDFAVPEIAAVLEQGDNALSVLEQKEVELTRKMAVVENGLRFLEVNRGVTPFVEDVRETKLSLFQVATMEGRGSVRDIAVHLKLLSRYIRNYGALECGPTGTFFYPDSTFDDFHFKVFVPVNGEWLIPTNGFVIENFGMPRFLYLRHYGSYELLAPLYERLRIAVEERGETLDGSYIELYRNPPHQLLGSDTSLLITDIGVPLWY